MGVDDLADDGQTEAGAARLRREERVEDAILQVVGMPAPSSATSTTTVGIEASASAPGPSSPGTHARDRHGAPLSRASRRSTPGS
jgi:hypothetical protein